MSIYSGMQMTRKIMRLYSFGLTLMSIPQPPEAFDKYLSAQIITDRGGEMLCSMVKSWKHDSDGKPIRSSNSNPILGTR
jgi:hypothetical protein